MFVVCSGMMRSGSTLQYNIARDLCLRLDVPSLPQGPLDANVLGSRDELRRLGDDSVIHIVKMHDIDYAILEVSADHDVRFPYISRDIRDVAVSLKNKKLADLDHIMERLDVAMECYTALRDAGAATSVLWQRYEEAVADVPAAVRQIAEFLGLEAPPNVVEKVARACSLDTAKRITSQLRGEIREHLRQVGEHTDQGRELRKRMRNKDLSFWEETTMLHYDHISKNEGASGVWKTQLPQEEVDVLVARYGWWLAENGYSTLDDAPDPA